ncbi:hypothetical protein FIBSPDRAFT_38377 [Athelia psychrophila]|uniref:Ubiquitin-like domain-containing protein n=1 Tax=Athelia psychrophila TaxID=1759441 RepID=A0A166FJC8_9AGAM|nr:hypothetical protein FIBSPDRAFT_38377 [Fibularhizoctonia sp. CBS 109695]
MISGFCRGVAGDVVILRGDYRILDSEDDQVINPEEFAFILQPGMAVDLSIVFHDQAEERQGSEGYSCPRCQHANSRYTGWVNCANCNVSFTISPGEKSIVSPETEQYASTDDRHLFRKISVFQAAAGIDGRELPRDNESRDSQAAPEPVEDEHRSVAASIDDRESLREDEPQDPQAAPEPVDDGHGSVIASILAGIVTAGIVAAGIEDRESLREDEPQDSQAAPELVDDEHGLVAAEIDDKESAKEGDPGESQAAPESVDDGHSSVAASIDDRESLREDEPQDSQAAPESVDDEHGSVAAGIDGGESVGEDEPQGSQVAPEPVDNEHGPVAADIDDRVSIDGPYSSLSHYYALESAKDGNPWESQVTPPRQPRQPRQPRRLHIRASGEVSADQMARLDVTRRVEFQKHRSNLIGEGSYGQVYKAWYIRSNGQKILVGCSQSHNE